MDWRTTGQKLKDQEERVEKLEREFKALVLDWEEMYDKFRRLLARISKRHEMAEKAEEAPGHTDSLDPAQLTLNGNDRVQELNRRIRENRGRSAL